MCGFSKLPAKLCQHGMALITVMFALALVTTLSAYLVETQFINIRRAENLQDSEQAYEYALESEAWASRILARDKATTEYDYAGEPWNKLSVPIAVDEGTLKTAVTDLQSRFNINNLREPPERRVWYAAFQRLLKLLDLDTALAGAVVDWIDPDSNLTPPKGAEDYDYLGLDPPYRAANTDFADISELLWVKGFDRKTFDILKPYITALPPGTRINVNTCDPLLYRILAPGMNVLNEQEAEQLLTGRGEKGYPDSGQFLTATPMSGNNGAVAQQLIDVASRYFQIRSEAQVGKSRVVLLSDVERTAGPNNTVNTQVISRSRVLR
jgi:general secretion pathway protein K